MEPGWVVLLCSLFVQMFFTVLVHAGIRLSHTNTASARTHRASSGAIALTRPLACAAHSSGAIECGARRHRAHGAIAGRRAGDQVRVVGLACAESLLLLVRRRRATVAHINVHVRVTRRGCRVRYTLDGLQHMGRDLGILSPVEFAITCEAKQDLFRQERNALICGASLFLYFVLGRWPKK